MFDKVLVGIDGRAGGKDAIALAQRLAAPGAQVIFANVYGPPTAAGRAGALAVNLELEAAERLLTNEVRQASRLVETAVIYESSVGRGLHQLAERRNADLLAVGSCHRGVLGRVLLGDDTNRTLNGAPCAVAIAPRGYVIDERRLRRIGVGYDKSPESRSALKVARVLGLQHGATVEALGVVTPDSILRGEASFPRWPKVAGELVETAHRLDVPEGVEGSATHGDPAKELVEFSAELDLLIVGSRGDGQFGRLLNGSTSNYLARRAHCPLLVIPRRASYPAARSDADRPTALGKRVSTQ